MDLYAIIDEYVREGKGGALATIVKKLGAAPREEGAKMFIGLDGRFFGTIGGGCIEAEVWQEAQKVAKTGNPKMLHYTMNGSQLADEGMICGGNVDIFVEPLLDRYHGLYEEAEQLEKQGKRGLIVTTYAGDTISKGLVCEDGSVYGDVVEEGIRERLHEYLQSRRPAVVDRTVIEPILSTAFLYIFGAGHVSQYVSRVAAMADFSVTVIDDRDSFANRERFPEAEQVIVEEFKDIFRNLRFHGSEYVVILTRGHKHDALVLEEVMKQPPRYVGMIGSKRKVKMVMDYLKEKGFDEKLLRSVHAPIGLDIHAETPQEIAVSIVAELIKVKREES